MQIKWLGIVSIIWSSAVWAACPQVEFLRNKATPKEINTTYENCAIYFNDDESQSILAKRYAAGTDGVKKNLNRALYFYQLSAENGNAESQAQLARLYMELDRTPATRKLMVAYMETIYSADMKSVRDTHGPSAFRGELIHPYALLLLASEPVENKWFYPSKVLKAPDYVEELLKTYPLDENKKKQQMLKAVEWKKRKLLDVASKLMSKEEYNQFKEAVVPESGRIDKERRDEALAKFRQRYEEYYKGK